MKVFIKSLNEIHTEDIDEGFLQSSGDGPENMPGIDRLYLNNLCNRFISTVI